MQGFCIKGDSEIFQQGNNVWICTSPPCWFALWLEQQEEMQYPSYDQCWNTKPLIVVGCTLTAHFGKWNRSTFYSSLFCALYLFQARYLRDSNLVFMLISISQSTQVVVFLFVCFLSLEKAFYLMSEGWKLTSRKNVNIDIEASGTHGWSAIVGWQHCLCCLSCTRGITPSNILRWCL